MSYAIVCLISCLSGTILGWRLKKSILPPPNNTPQIQVKKSHQLPDGRLQDIITYLPEQDRLVIESALADTEYHLSPITKIILDVVSETQLADVARKSMERGYWKPTKFEYDTLLSRIPYPALDTDKLNATAKRRNLDVF